MSRKERTRLAVLARIRDGQLGLRCAAELLGISYRQARRAYKRFRDEGDAGLVHRLRGRASNRKADDATRTAVLALYREKYHDFGPTLACEYLAKHDGYDALSHDTLGRWLRAAGLFEPRRKRGKHRSRRARRARFGEMVQMDGSPHAWFEDRGDGACCLMVMVDDATGRMFCRFYARETLAAAFDVFRRYAQLYGLPRALYVDRAGVYRSDAEPTAEQRLAGAEPVTQFGRAMAELGVALIRANSPQAKGRVERMNRTLQDRLVKALRLAEVSTVAAANAVLDASAFLAEFNEQFRVEPTDAIDAHAAVGPMTAADLSEVLCEHEQRCVGKDWCVQWRGRLLQIDAAHEALGLAAGKGKRVIVREMADGAVHVLWDGQKLAWRLVERRPKRAKVKKPVVNNKRWVPAADHPWKRAGPAGRASSATPPQPFRRDQR